MVDRKNVLRLRRSRLVGGGMLVVMTFLIAGFVFVPVASSIDDIAPFVDDLQVPTPDFEATEEQFMEENPDLPTPPNLDEFIPPEEVIEEIPPETEPNFDEPITSNSTIPEQIGDENIDNPISIFPTSDTIGLLVETTKIDSNGTRITEEFRVEFSALDFLGEEATGLDFSQGSLEFRMWLESEPDISINGNGFFDFQLNGVSETGITTLIVAGSPDQNGLLPIEFVTSTGRSPVFEYSIADNNDKFPLNSRTELSARVFDFLVLKDLRDEFIITDAEVFSMDILNSADVILITNEQGGTEVLFPNDDTLKISASTEGGMMPHPSMGAIKVTDSQGFAVASSTMHTGKDPRAYSSSGTYGASPAIIDSQIARDSTYTIEIGSPTPLSFTLETPLSQKNYDFSCRYVWEDVSATGRAPATSASGARQYFVYQLYDFPALNVICNMPPNETTTFNQAGEVIG